MKNSPLQLLRYVVPEFSCSANQKFDPEKQCDNISEQFSVAANVLKQNPPEGFPIHSWVVEMRISQQLKEGQNFPYKYELVLVGFFACKEDSPPDFDEERFVRINGSSILYGAARELVRSVTTLGPWGEVFMPTVSFYDNPPNQKAEAPPSP